MSMHWSKPWLSRVASYSDPRSPCRYALQLLCSKLCVRAQQQLKKVVGGGCLASCQSQPLQSTSLSPHNQLMMGSAWVPLLMSVRLMLVALRAF